MILVIPCYNEAGRLDGAAFARMAARDASLELLFIDDGSRDETPNRLEELRARAAGRIRVIRLGRNRGKAEAVRQGLLEALAGDVEIVGYLDADLATPPDEMARLIGAMRATGASVLMASRVALLGREIQRSGCRHYMGRAFATIASRILGLTVYDTQCGAKLLRRSRQLEAALAEPFLSRWVFDVELLGRLLIGRPGVPGLSAKAIVEEPLLVWRDMAGSKLRWRHMIRAAVDTVRIANDLLIRRRRQRRQPKRDD